MIKTPVRVRSDLETNFDDAVVDAEGSLLFWTDWCEDEDAAEIVRILNAHKQLVHALHMARKRILFYHDGYSFNVPDTADILNQIDAALAAARGEG